MTAVRGFLKDEQGASMAEYAMLLALIAVATIAAVQALRARLREVTPCVWADCAGNAPVRPPSAFLSLPFQPNRVSQTPHGGCACFAGAYAVASTESRECA
jgi:Flp pilus assembly pilin Flp